MADDPAPTRKQLSDVIAPGLDDVSTPASTDGVLQLAGEQAALPDASTTPRPIRKRFAVPVAFRHEERTLVAATGRVPPLDPNPFKLGILGGKESGKSYLFQSMVYRLYRGSFGPMGYFMGDAAISVYEAHTRATADGTDLSEFQALQIDAMVRDFKLWYRLPTTKFELQRWFRLQFPFRTGWLGRRRSTIEVSFLDGSGEILEQGVRDDNIELWRKAFVDAEVMVFCLPMWCAFPYLPSMTDDDWEDVDKRLTKFGNVLTSYRELRKEAAKASEKPPARVTVIVALTMADDIHCEGESQHSWVQKYLKNADRLLGTLRTGSGVSRYLANARLVSRRLIAACDSPKVDERISNLRKLDFGRGEPWLIPMSALDGHKLLSAERSELPESDRRRLGPPVPAHVELPLLIALSERYNALA